MADIGWRISVRSVNSFPCDRPAQTKSLNKLAWSPKFVRTSLRGCEFPRPKERFGHSPNRGPDRTGSKTIVCCCLGATNPQYVGSLLLNAVASNGSLPVHEVSIPSDMAMELMYKLVLLDLDPATAKVLINIVGPFLSAFALLFVARIVMSWYPKLPVGKFPYVIAYAPTEPVLIPTRKLIPPLGGVDVTPVVWFGLVSFLNEILVGPQGLLVLLSQQA